MSYKPQSKDAEMFIEKMKGIEQTIVGCEKCACLYCVNYNKCHWEICRKCGMGEYSLPCKDFREK